MQNSKKMRFYEWMAGQKVLATFWFVFRTKRMGSWGDNSPSWKILGHEKDGLIEAIYYDTFGKGINPMLPTRSISGCFLGVFCVVCFVCMCFVTFIFWLIEANQLFISR